jgi:murein DD-endopeptidase MepM/ murein hydrolase activator NlpD
MKKPFLLLTIVIVLTIAGSLAYIFLRKSPARQLNNAPTTPTVTPTTSLSPSPTAQPSPTQSLYADPVTNFKARVAKKPFGIYITPQNSPIQPERFTGYHTGADAEYTDVAADVPVFAIADGTVVLSETASGYGGVFMISFSLSGTQHTALYGHIRPSSLPKVGTKVTKGQQLGLLGTGYSSETDGERRHLHFAVLADNSLNIKGYVGTKSQLSGWIDPLTLY